MMPFFYPSPRVSQLDASILDTELVSLLKDQLVSVFQLKSNEKWSYNQNPEFYDLCLNLIVFRLTIWKTGTSYGLLLQNLKLSNYKNGRPISYFKKTILGGLIVGSYLYNRLQSYMYSENNLLNTDDEEQSFLQKIKRLLATKGVKVVSFLNDSLKIVNLLNFVLFILNGKFPSLVDRVLGITLTPIVNDLLKYNGDNVNFEFQNRQLVWNVLTEFLVFILPVLKVNKIKNNLVKAFGSITNKNSVSTASLPSETPFSNLSVSQCAICFQKSNIETSGNSSATVSSCLITNPFVTNCGHIYCYVCIATRFNALENSADNESCPRCGMKLEWFKPYGMDDEMCDKAIIVAASEDSDSEDSIVEVSDSEKSIYQPELSQNDEQEGSVTASESSSIQENDQGGDESSFSEEYDYGDSFDDETFEL